MKTACLYLPTNIVSFLAGKLAQIKFPPAIARKLIEGFCRIYAIDTGSCAAAPGDFASIGEYFLREIKAQLRPIAAGLVSPVDGVLRDYGPVKNGLIEHVKGRSYSLKEFLESAIAAERFSNGYYFNFYLSPADCHHVFSPLSGEIIASTYIPGALFPVNDWSFKAIRRLFCINERLVTYFRTEMGAAALVMVGATCVGQMSLVYDDWKTNSFGKLRWCRNGAETERIYDKPIRVKAGEKIGSFSLGSSVVLLFENRAVSVKAECGPGARVRYGCGIGEWCC